MALQELVSAAACMIIVIGSIAVGAPRQRAGGHPHTWPKKMIFCSVVTYNLTPEKTSVIRFINVEKKPHETEVDRTHRTNLRFRSHKVLKALAGRFAVCQLKLARCDRRFGNAGIKKRAAGLKIESKQMQRRLLTRLGL